MPVDEQGREYSEDWEFGSGLMDDFDGTVVRSEFGYDEKYTDDKGDQQVLFIATIQPDDGSDELRQLFSVGKEFEVLNKGRTIAKAKSGKLIKTTMYARLNAAAVKEYPDFKFRGSPLGAGIFDGTSWHWKILEFKQTIRGEERVNEHLMPVKFNKLVTPANTASGGAASGGAAGGSSTGSTTVGSAEEELRDEVTMLARAHDTHQLFLKAIVNDKELNARVKAAGLTRSVIDDKATGYWSKARTDA